MAFRIGQMVRITWSPSPERIGVVCKIVSDLQRMSVWSPSKWVGVIRNGTLGHVIDLDPRQSGTGSVSYPPCFLEPYYPPQEKSDESLEDILLSIKNIKARVSEDV